MYSPLVVRWPFKDNSRDLYKSVKICRFEKSLDVV